MDKVEEIFSQEELDYLSKERPDLVPMDLPSPSDVVTLKKPSLDQIIVKFLKKYEVNVEPRTVGKWNGWDTVSTMSSLLSSSKGSMGNIASTMFYANRSNQINSAAQDWGTWKRWVFDSKEKEFEQFKNELIKSINTFNKKSIEENEEKIRKATLNNQKIFKVLKEPHAQKKIAELKELAKQLAKEKKELVKESWGQKSFMFSIYGLLLFLLIAILSFFGVLTTLVGLMAMIVIVMNLSGVAYGIRYLFSNPQEKYLGQIGIALSTTLLIFFISLL